MIIGRIITALVSLRRGQGAMLEWCSGGSWLTAGSTIDAVACRGSAGARASVAGGVARRRQCRYIDVVWAVQMLRQIRRIETTCSNAVLVIFLLQSI
jgi:hypothetical protein